MNRGSCALIFASCALVDTLAGVSPWVVAALIFGAMLSIII